MSLALAVVLGTCLALAGPAGAVKPDKEPAPFAEATGEFCEGFAVHIRATTEAERSRSSRAAPR